MSTPPIGGGGGGGGLNYLHAHIHLGSGIPTTRPKTGYPV